MKLMNSLRVGLVGLVVVCSTALAVTNAGAAKPDLALVLSSVDEEGHVTILNVSKAGGTMTIDFGSEVFALDAFDAPKMMKNGDIVLQSNSTFMNIRVPADRSFFEYFDKRDARGVQFTVGVQ